MRLFITDDCNVTWDPKVDYFLYGGIVVPDSEARVLAEQLLTLKAGAGIRKERPVKWSNNKWKGEALFNEKIHAAIKNQVLDLVRSSGARIIVCVSPQGFYHTGTMKGEKVRMAIDVETQKRTQQYALNDVVAKFHSYLEEVDDQGMILADKFGQGVKAHMDEHCMNSFPRGRTPTPRIIHPIIQLDNEESHLHQINDVVLGSIYFSLREMGFNFLPAIRDNFWMREVGDYSSILYKGFNIYPLRPAKRGLVASNQALEQKFNRLITV
ncbi:MAG: hypothetical protein JWN64_70 [Parcubacteria group bacterium]|nr:hypothetical protein [Parcubacteria group bacterium]